MSTVLNVTRRCVVSAYHLKLSCFGAQIHQYNLKIGCHHNNRPTTIHIDRKMSTFKFTDYDCIGFDLDNTVARYKIGAMIEMEYEVMADYLIRKGYSDKHLSKPFDHNFIIRGLILDDYNGNLLRIAPDGYILQVCHGTRMLDEAEIERYYPGRHWEPTDLFAADPLSTWNGPHSEKMRTLLDYFDIATSLVFARIVDSIDERNGGPQLSYELWPDLLECLQDMFQRENFQLDKGNYFPRMKSEPEKYYYKCSEKLLSWFKELKAEGKLLYLITGAHVDFATLTASNTIGEDWRDYFDIVVTFSKKPGFFTMKRDFLALNAHLEMGRVKELQKGGIYSQGNWEDLHKFFQNNMKNPDGKFLYIGDNLVQDIYTPNVHSHCETVTVCEELEAEGHDGHEKWHPDEQFLISTVWGSYFHCKTTNKITNWYHIMKTHSKICVPSLEYIALLPIDKEYECNKIEYEN